MAKNAEAMKPKKTVGVMKVVTEHSIKAAEKVLADNGVEAGDVQVVLQALGYVLLDRELYEEEGDA